MQRADAPRTPFEVYCFHCQSSFAIGTRRCVHCGRRLGGRAERARLEARPAPIEASGQPGSGPIEASRQTSSAPIDAIEEETAEVGLVRRIGGTSLWVIVAIAAAASRFCAEG